MAKLRITYFKIIKLKNYINDTYSFQLFITVASSFIEAIYFSFFLIVLLREPEIHFANLSRSKIIQIVIWTTTVALRMVGLVICCNSMAQKIKKAGPAINDFLMKPVDPQTDHQVKFLMLKAQSGKWFLTGSFWTPAQGLIAMSNHLQPDFDFTLGSSV